MIGKLVHGIDEIVDVNSCFDDLVDLQNITMRYSTFDEVKEICLITLFGYFRSISYLKSMIGNASFLFCSNFI